MPYEAPQPEPSLMMYPAELDHHAVDERIARPVASEPRESTASDPAAIAEAAVTQPYLLSNWTLAFSRRTGAAYMAHYDTGLTMHLHQHH